MRTLFAITHVDTNGRWTLTFANQGRSHYSVVGRVNPGFLSPRVNMQKSRLA